MSCVGDIMADDKFINIEIENEEEIALKIERQQEEHRAHGCAS